MKRQATLRTDINITPLIDIVLVLLIVFIVMVPAMGVAQRAQAGGRGAGGRAAVDLPRIMALGEGRYRLGETEEMGREELVDRMAQALRVQAPADRKVVLVVPADAPLSVASAGMDALHQAAGRIGQARDVRAVLVEGH